MEAVSEKQNDGLRAGAQVVSYLFHPLLLCTYLVLTLGYFMPRFYSIPPAALLRFTGFVFVMTFILPVANLLMLKSVGSLKSLHMVDRSERVLPFVLIALIYAVVTYMFFYKLRTNMNFNKVMVLVTVMIMLATAVTLFHKISIHSLATAGCVGLLLPLNKVEPMGSLMVPTVVMMVLAGLTMSARLYLQVHTLREVMAGAVAGFSVGFFGMIILF
jgi:membrane-associated phospholipid phosphatase